MNILGINGSIGWDGNLSAVGKEDLWVHGSGATLFIDGELMGAISEERLTRIKYEGNYPENAITQLLSRHNLTEDDVDIVGYVSNACAMAFGLKLQGYTNTRLSKIFPNARIMFVDHHLAHAAASFLTSKFSEANIFSFDGAGDYHPSSYDDAQNLRLNNSAFFNGDIKSKKIHPIYHTYLQENNTFNTFGSFYGEVSWIVYQNKVNGWRGQNDNTATDTEVNVKSLQRAFQMCSFNDAADVTDCEYELLGDIYGGPISRETFPGKIMGLASYGDWTKVPFDDPFELRYIDDMPAAYQRDDVVMNFTFDTYSAEDLANWLQHYFEKYLLLLLKNIPKKIKTKNLCLSGGCALNILANSKIIDQGIYEDVHINPAPNDDGLNFGAAIFCAFKHEKELILPDNIGTIGLEYSNEDIEEVIHIRDTWTMKYKLYDDFEELCEVVVDKLEKNKTVGWFQGKSEFGPRALGNRTLLANPTFDNKDYINDNIKHRESWRPYAPIMLEEELHNWYVIPKDSSPYMLFNAFLCEDKIGKIPSVTHYDNSARIQTVTKTLNEKMYTLLQSFFRRTSVPILLNTSFNVGGEPIVETPQDAFKTFKNSNIDYLVMNNFIFSKRENVKH